MAYRLTFERQAQKYLAGLRDAKLLRRLRQAFEKLAADPRPPGCVKLQGEEEWGQNGGRLGDGTSTNRSSPVQIGTDTDWESVSGAFDHTVAVKTNGTLWAWGSNTRGQLGDGTNTQRLSPVQIGTDTDWLSAVALGNTTLAMKTDGTLWAWGENTFGQLGDGTTANRNVPAQIGTSDAWGMLPDGGMSKATHALVVAADGTLWGFGYNVIGQLQTAARNSTRPEQVDPVFAPQTVTFPAVSYPAYGVPVELAATSTSGLPVSYGVSGPATLSGNELTVSGPGEVNLVAWHPGDDIWDSSEPVTTTVVAGTPEIDIEQPSGIILTDGVSSIDFGHTWSSGPKELTFTIRNVGTGLLSGFSIGKDGANAADFTVGSTGATSLATGESTTFTVAFDPTAKGVRNAAIQIVSNDEDESPFDIAVTGLGATPSEAWRYEYFGTLDNTGEAADSADPEHDGLINLVERAFGLNPWANSAGQIPAPQIVGGNFELRYTPPPDAEGILLGAEYSISLMPGDWVPITDTGTFPELLFSVPIEDKERMFMRWRLTPEPE